MDVVAPGIPNIESVALHLFSTGEHLIDLYLENISQASVSYLFNGITKCLEAQQWPPFTTLVVEKNGERKEVVLPGGEGPGTTTLASLGINKSSKLYLLGPISDAPVIEALMKKNLKRPMKALLELLSNPSTYDDVTSIGLTIVKQPCCGLEHLSSAQDGKSIATGNTANVFRPFTFEVSFGSTPLIFAAAYAGSTTTELCLALIGEGANVMAANESGQTALHFAAMLGDVPLMEALVAKGADVKAALSNGDTPLHMAAQSGMAEAIRLLVAKGVDITTLGYNGQTALHAASSGGHVYALRELVASGADIETKCLVDGFTSLHKACQTENLYAISFLIAKGAEIGAVSQKGFTPLCIAASCGYTKIVKALINKGADVKTADEDGDTPLHWAAIRGHPETVKLLVAKGADIAAKNKKGLTPSQTFELAGSRRCSDTDAATVRELLAEKFSFKFAF